MGRKQPVVAIDGPAGSGKSTVAKLVASRLGFSLVDTGAIYRCVALGAKRTNVDWNDGPATGKVAGSMVVRFQMDDGKNRVWLDDEDVTENIRSPEISQGASIVSAHPEVRRALLDMQRSLGRDGAVVLEGRDIGTVVFPDAEVKVFLDAPPEERARRRNAELEAKGEHEPLEKTLAEVQERDQRDRNRAVAPLKAAADAIVVDTGPLSIEQVVAKIIGLVKQYAGSA